ncbi:MAG: transglycosylase SLT domain-containing protein, partial [Anaerolineaceae bacterium]
VGAVIGGMVGAFLGDQAGQIIGDTVGGWVNDLRNADIPGMIGNAWNEVKVTALGTWDWIKTGWDSVVGTLQKGWDATMTAFSAVGDTIKKAWGGFVDTAKAGWESVSGAFASAYEGLKSIPVIGPAIQAVEDAAKKTAAAASAAAEAAKAKAAEVGTKVIEKGKEVAQDTKEKAVEVGTKAAEGVKQGAEYLGNNTTIGKGVKAAGQGAAFVAEKTSAAAERAYNVTAATAGSALETIMPKGYRHKALFDGIQGGVSLTKYGSYTDEEAAKIRELKTSGANTSANVKGGMSLEVQDKISAQAKKVGLDPVMMQKIASMESGGNANAISSTGAAGIYQFTGQTASGVGIKNRFDVDQNIEGGMKLTRQNQAALEKSGLPVSAENLYMMHQLGPKAAQEVIRGAADGKSKEDMSPETQKAMDLNYGANSKTAADYLATNKKALDDRYAAVTKDTGGVPTAIAKANSATPAPPPATPDSSSTPPIVAQVAPPALPSSIAAPAMPSVVASASMPSVPAPPSVPTMPSAPPMTVLMTGGGPDKPIQVLLPSQDVGQDLRDRPIAHIVTGGLSA